MAEQIPIHQGPISDSENQAPQAQGSHERTLIQTLKKLHSSAKAAREKYDKEWPTRQDYYKGKQWDGTNKKPVMNIIRSTIQTILPLLTDAKPGINVMGAEPNDYQFAQNMEKVVQAWWEAPEVSMAHTLLEPLTDMMIRDVGVLKVFWDDEANDGRGDARVKCPDPENIYVNKEARDFDKDCYYVIERSYPTVSWIKRKFPDKASLIKSDSAKKDDDKRGDIAEINLQSPTDQKWPVDNKGFINEEDCRETAECWECWVDSDELEEYSEDKGEGKVERGYKKKYPQGKLITMLPNQNIILQEVANPYKHGKKPYVRFVDAIMPRSFYGEGEAECLMGAQKNVNNVLANILAYLKLMANPIWKNASDSGVDSNDITNDTALVLETDPGKLDQVQRDIPPALQAGILDLYTMMLRNAEIESGVNDSSQGRRPTGITAGIAIESLQEAAQTRIRLKERNLQVSLSKMGFMLVQLFMQFYKTPRVARITGQAEWPEYFEYYVEETPDGYLMNQRPYQYDEAAKKYVPGEYQTTGPTRGIFDVKILSGTSLPFAKTEKMNLALKLYQMGALTLEGLLNQLEWPNAAQEIRKIQEQQQVAAAQQQQAAAQKQAGQ